MSSNYLTSRSVKSMFKTYNFTFELKNIVINGTTRGCTGFLINNDTGKVCYINTEPHSDRGGLWGDKDKAVMMRSAQHTRDFTGGRNSWLPVTDIIRTAFMLTASDEK